MSIFDTLPESVSIAGKEYAVNTDFRAWMKIEGILSGNIGDKFSRLADALLLCYRELPENPEQAVEGMLWFYSLGEPGGSSGKAKAPIYNFEDDAEYIYAAFLSEFGIDLCTAQLHWWKFRALFLALSENSKFSKVLAFRTVDVSKIKDKEQKRYYERMKKLYKLPDRRTEAEKEQAFAESLEMFF